MTVPKYWVHSIVKHSDTPPDVFRVLWYNLKRGRPFCCTFKNKAKYGSSYWVKRYLAPHWNEKGEIVGYMSSGHLVTPEDIAQLERPLHEQALSLSR
jgi:hypothetical protein